MGQVMVVPEFIIEYKQIPQKMFWEVILHQCVRVGQIAVNSSIVLSCNWPFTSFDPYRHVVIRGTLRNQAVNMLSRLNYCRIPYDSFESFMNSIY